MNCMKECQSRIMDENCGCVVYYMPRIRPDINICSRKDHKCFNMVRTAVELGLNQSFVCKCLPACFEVGYGNTLAISRVGNDQFILREMEGLLNGTSEQIRLVYWNLLLC